MDELYAKLMAEYTGDVKLKIRTIDGKHDYDFEWLGNEYVMVSNVYLEDVDPTYVRVENDILIFDGYVHVYRCGFVIDYPDFDQKLFKKISESVKEGAVW